MYFFVFFSISELVQERQKSPWLWPDMIYNITSSGRKHRKNLNILHGFTNEVRNLVRFINVESFRLQKFLQRHIF